VTLGHQIKAPYNIKGLITIVLSQCTILGLRHHFLQHARLPSPKVVCIFLIIFCKCWFQVSLESKITPRYLTSSSIFRSLPCSFRGLKHYLTPVGKWDYGCFVRSHVKTLFTVHFAIMFRALCISSLTVSANLPWTMMTISSA
jgi:hypothetical protein